MIRASMVLLFLVFGSMASFAEEAAPSAPAAPTAPTKEMKKHMKPHRKEMIAACAPDVAKLCPDAEKPRDKMKCLRGKKDEVSEACRAEWKELKKERKKMSRESAGLSQ